MAARRPSELRLDRRVFLAALASGVTATACGSPQRGNQQAPSPPMIRGANITVDATPWAGLWANWDWAGWIKWQVDALAALGGNTVRLIGGIGGITDGRYSLSQYLGRWEQFLDYTADTGTWVYPCGGGLGHWSSTSDEQAQDIYRDWGALVDRYDHVLGIDVTNEAFGEGIVSAGRSEESVFATLRALTSALRQVTATPIAHSQVLLGAADWVTPRGRRLQDISDFYDFHLYYTPAQPATDVRRLLRTPWADKPVLIGEVGENTTAPSSARALRYRAAETIVRSDKRFMGALAWAITDTVPGEPPSQYGLVDRAGVARSDIVRLFQTWPTSRR
ncbi:hypothetical protein [Geodermatophilus sp. SYSU D00710]